MVGVRRARQGIGSDAPLLGNASDTGPEEPTITRRMIIGTSLLILIAIPVFSTELQLRRLTQLIVLVLAVLGVNLLTGYTGMISLGHGVFVGIGAFATANLIDASVPLWAAVIIATVYTGVAGVILGLPAIRLRGLSLALVTFGYAIAFQPISRKLGGRTGGTSGRPVATDFLPPGPLADVIAAPVWRYIVCLAVVAIWFLLTRNLIASRVGRAARAVRDGELAAAQFGVDIVRTKTAILGISAAMAGTAGALQAALFPWVSADQFDALLSLRLYAAAVLGGLGTILGALFGIVALIVLPVINAATGVLDNDAVVFGLGLVIMSLVAPQGLAGVVERRRSQADVNERWSQVGDATIGREGEPTPPAANQEPTVQWIDLDLGGPD